MTAGEYSLIAQTAAVWYMAGTIWTMQILNYPLLTKVGRTNFTDYASAHNKRFIRVVGPGVLVTTIATVLLLADKPPELDWIRPAIIAALLLVVIISTAAYQGRAHSQLSAGYDEKTIDVLVKSNWIRTAAWTAMGGIDVWMTLDVMR